jgi:hypothetical protein
MAVKNFGHVAMNVGARANEEEDDGQETLEVEEG